MFVKITVLGTLIAFHVSLAFGKSRIPECRIGSVAWVQATLEKYPELKWLADDDVTITNDFRASSSDSYSGRLFGKQYVEFDRTFLSFEFFHRTLRGSEDDYRWLVQNQQPKDALKRESFDHIRRAFNEIVSDESGDLTLFEVAIVLGDMGKTTTTFACDQSV